MSPGLIIYCTLNIILFSFTIDPCAFCHTSTETECSFDVYRIVNAFHFEVHRKVKLYDISIF
jgi:hypothetical protein